MGNYAETLKYLRSSEAATQFASIYGKREGVLVYQTERYCRIHKKHCENFGPKENVRFFSAPGRTEIGGNHTDHNSGKVLAAGINFDTIAAVTPNDKNIITLHSEGYNRPFIVDLADTNTIDKEKGSTAALVRGTALRMKELGYTIGGFDAVVTSNVLNGSGLSSSAAFEVLICAIFDGLYNNWSVDGKLRAKIAQYVEINYFGKPCGLMDQMASSLGGLITMDFRRADPDVQSISYDFAAKGYALIVVNTGGTHANLTSEYAAIPHEMKAVAEVLGGKVLRDVMVEQVEDNLALLKTKVSDRAILRALHYFDENKRVKEQVAALKNDDLTTFFEKIILSGESSWKLLQNIYVGGSSDQGLALALEMSRRMLQGKGAWRIHGGGFAGTIQAFVPQDLIKKYTTKMNSIFGDGACSVLDIRPVGAIEFKQN